MPYDEDARREPLGAGRSPAGEDTIQPRSEWAYHTEDGAFVDEEGYITILGRVDDVLNVSGHRFGTMEIESAIAGVEGIAEAAVVSGGHDVRGKGVHAYVSTEDGHEGDDALRAEAASAVEAAIGPIARPEAVVFTPEMHKTRSGKIMRRLLEDIASGEELGDLSALRTRRSSERSSPLSTARDTLVLEGRPQIEPAGPTPRAAAGTTTDDPGAPSGHGEGTARGPGLPRRGKTKCVVSHTAYTPKHE